jgi:hypothetical protein
MFMSYLTIFVLFIQNRSTIFRDNVMVDVSDLNDIS